MVRINGVDLRAALAALKFFNLGVDQTFGANNTDLCEQLKAEGYDVLNPAEQLKESLDTYGQSTEDMVIHLSSGLDSLRFYHKSEDDVCVYYHNTPDNIQVYVDMDGVVANFEGFFIDMFGKERFESMTPKELWGTHMNNMLTAEEDVFAAFKPLDRMQELYESFKPYNPIFLSSTGFSNTEEIEKQKRAWLEKYFGTDVKSIFVNQSKKKAYYAAPNTILIDDRAKSLFPFVQAGGEGILHVDVESTMEKFEEVYARVKRRTERKDTLKL